MEFLEKIRNANAKLHDQLSDLFASIGYFGLCLYVGGISYITSFNDYFGISILERRGVFETSVVFFDAFKLDSFGYLIVTILIMILAFIFFLSCFVFRLYFGYMLIITIFCIAMLLALYSGSILGRRAALDLVDITKSNLPTFISDISEKYRDGSFKLLHDDGKYFYITELVVRDSIIQIEILSKNEITSYEVIR